MKPGPKNQDAPPLVVWGSVYCAIHTIVHLVNCIFTRVHGGDPHVEALKAAGYYIIVLAVVWWFWPLRLTVPKTSLSIINKSNKTGRHP